MRTYLAIYHDRDGEVIKRRFETDLGLGDAYREAMKLAEEDETFVGLGAAFTAEDDDDAAL